MNYKTNYMAEELYLNTLTFEYPKEPVTLYFSDKGDAQHKSTILKSLSLIPKEIKNMPEFANLLSKDCKELRIYTSFDKPKKNFKGIKIDFCIKENQNLVKRYYNYKLQRYFQYYKDIIVTKSGITNDLQIWIQNKDIQGHVTYNNHPYQVFQMDRYTLKVRFDTFNHTPYLLVACDRPAQLLNIPLSTIFASTHQDPFENSKVITPSMINKVMTRKEISKDGKVFVVRNIDRYKYLHENSKNYDPATTRPIIGAALKIFFEMEHRQEARSNESKYVKYYKKIEEFRTKFLNNRDIEDIFKNIAYHFTPISQGQIGQIGYEKRSLNFGNNYHSNRQQEGINFGPCIKSPYIDVRLIFIYPKNNIADARNLIKYIKEGGYKTASKSLSAYTGTNIGYAEKDFHIQFCNEENPIPEIEKALQRDCYKNLSNNIKYVGIYMSPIHKYASEQKAKACYYLVKENFLRLGIPTQCIERDKMLDLIKKDEINNKSNFSYTLQNMGVAICAKLGGSPWLLTEPFKKELIIGISAFKSDNQQYIGTAFSFDNTGIFNDYQYFQKDEIDELVGCIQLAIKEYSCANNLPERLIIHYYKKMSHKKEFQKIENMLNSLNLDIPVYVISINKTESEDFVCFDKNSTFLERNFHTKADNIVESLMPYSGTFVNLGKEETGYRYLLCNNTRYEGSKFNKMDGFPFPIKLNISCPNKTNDIDNAIIQQLIEQVYQFSRIYWKSVKQQGLPVSIKYPEMIAEIMPHFNAPKVYTDNKSLWFL